MSRDLRQELKDVMEEKGLSLSALSRAIGISTAAISQWFSGTYTGNVAKIDDAMQGFLIRLHEKQQTGARADFPFIMISASKMFMEVARITHLEGCMGLFFGDSGMGKTESAKHYAHRNSDVMFIEADMGYTARTLFKDILRRLKLEPKGSLHDMLEAAVSALSGSGRLIIVDEAEHLPYRALELLRRLHDKAQVGVLLVGMPRLYSNITGPHWEYKQLSRRIFTHGKAEALKAQDAEMVVSKILPSVNGLWQDFHRESAGNMAYLKMLLLRSRRIAEINNTEVNSQIVKKAAETLLLCGKRQ